MKTRLLIIFAVGIIGFTGIAFATHDPNQPYIHSIILDEVLPGEKLGEYQYLVPKRRYSAFVNTDIMTLLNGFKTDTLILTGAATNVCVHYTGADAHQLDFKIKVVEEATAGSSQESHEAALVALNYLQHGARVSIDTVLDAMKDFKFPD